MNSSISSSEPLAGVLALRPPSRTARIVIALAVALLAVEAVTRLKLIKTSKEFQQFQSYRPRAAALAQSPGVRIPIIGSSVVHEDVDPALFAARLGSLHDIKVHAENFSADHSYVNTWYYMLQRYFWRAGNDTDLVVVSFVGRSLYDKNEMEIGRLARFFTTVADWPEVLSTDLTTTSERIEFLLSTFWASYAARDRMQELVFGRLFPNYKTYAYQQQTVLLGHQLANPRRVRKQRSLVALERLLVAAGRHGTRLCFVAFPTMRADWNEQSYDEARRLIEEHGMAYIDLRVTALDTAGFDDDRVHMNGGGRTVFSRRLADAVAPALRPGALAAREPMPATGGTSPRVPVGSPRAVAHPGLPRIRTCAIHASGSSAHGFAARRPSTSAIQPLPPCDGQVSLAHTSLFRWQSKLLRYSTGFKDQALDALRNGEILLRNEFGHERPVRFSPQLSDEIERERRYAGGGDGGTFLGP